MRRGVFASTGLKIHSLEYIYSLEYISYPLYKRSHPHSVVLSECLVLINRTVRTQLA